MQVYNDAGEPATNNEQAADGEKRREMRARLIGPEASRALAFQTVAVRHFGPAAGIFLRQLLYRDGSGWDGDFWIYKSMKEWDEETGLKRRQQEKARKVLIGKGVMEEKKANGPDGRQRLFFRVDPWAVMETLGDELPYAKPSTSTQGCTVLPSGDHVQYYRAGTMSGNSAQAVQKTTQKTTQKNSPKGANTPSQENKEVELEKEHMTDLASRFKKAGAPLTDEDRDSIAGNLAHCIKTFSATQSELELVKSKLTYRRSEGTRVMPSEILKDVRGENASGTKEGSATPPEAIEALRNYRSEKTCSTHLRSFVGVAERFDFTSDKKPDWTILKDISPDDQEAARLAKQIRSVCKRAVREAREEGMAKMGPFNDPESSASAATLSTERPEGSPEGSTTTPEAAEGDKRPALYWTDGWEGELIPVGVSDEGRKAAAVLQDTDQDAGRVFQGFLNGRLTKEQAVEAAVWAVYGTFEPAGGTGKIGTVVEDLCYLLAADKDRMTA